LPATDFASETLSSPAPLAPTQENSRAEAVAAGKRASKQAGDSVEEVAKTKVASKSEETPTWKKAAWIAGGVVVGVAAGLVVAPMAVSLVTGGLFVAGEWLVVGGVAGAIGGGLLGNYFSK
jgi:hypothetical protein